MFWQCLYNLHSSVVSKHIQRCFSLTPCFLKAQLSRPNPNLPKLFSNAPEAILTPHGGKTHEQKKLQLDFFPTKQCPLLQNMFACCLTSLLPWSNQYLGFKVEPGSCVSIQILPKIRLMASPKSQYVRGPTIKLQLSKILRGGRSFAVCSEGGGFILEQIFFFKRNLHTLDILSNKPMMTISAVHFLQKNKSELSDNLFAMCLPSLRAFFRKWHAKFVSNDNPQPSGLTLLVAKSSTWTDANSNYSWSWHKIGWWWINRNTTIKHKSNNILSRFHQTLRICQIFSNRLSSIHIYTFLPLHIFPQSNGWPWHHFPYLQDQASHETLGDCHIQTLHRSPWMPSTLWRRTYFEKT